MTTEHERTNMAQAVSVDEAAELHRGKWIVMHVTQHDDHGAPTHGTILATGPTRRSIQEAVLAANEECRATGTQYYVYFGRELFHSGLEWAKTIDQIVERMIHGG